MKVLVAGDYCPHGRVAQLLDSRDYSSVFGEVRMITSQADYSILNFECPVVKGEAKPIEKSGPNLRCSESAVEAIKYAGFKCVTLANNHFLDYGNEGVRDTLNTLKNNEIDYVGGGQNLQAAEEILYARIEGHILAIINCCEHEFSIATEQNAGSNPLNPIRQYYAIQEARANADYVLVIVHGGHEHFQYPSLRMVEVYRFFIDAGADAVVNHHQHCFSGYETYHDKPIFYGLGNFCFDDPNNIHNTWNYGYAVTLIFTDKTTQFALHPLNQCSDKATVTFLPADAYNEKLCEINSAISNPELLKQVLDTYYNRCSVSASWLFEPVRIGLYFIMRYRGWIPSFITRDRKLDVANHVLCESYLDQIKWWLEH